MQCYFMEDIQQIEMGKKIIIKRKAIGIDINKIRHTVHNLYLSR